jgi:hypothetical protein
MPYMFIELSCILVSLSYVSYFGYSRIVQLNMVLYVSLPDQEVLNVPGG